MTWEDYIKGYNNVEQYMFNKYGELGKYKIAELETRMPITLGDEFNIADDIYEMVFGQFIMSERALTAGLEYNESLYNLAVAILRPKGDIIFDNTDKVKEEANIKLIMEQHAKDVLEECNEFSKKRNKFVKEDFKGVFYKADDEIEETDNEEDEDVEPESFEDKFNKDWYWYTIVNSLADNNILNHEPVLMMKMRDVAPHLSYMRIKGIIDFKRRKAEEIANKLKR